MLNTIIPDMTAPMAVDIKNGIIIDLPYNYFPGNDPSKPPKLTWRAHSTLLFNNWLNYFVYQETPYDITKI